MKVSETKLPGVLIFEPQVFGDSRGFFVETYRKSVLSRYGIPSLVQDNQSRSRRGVLRGLHYQMVNPQGKLVRVSQGRVFDVAVDVRRGSPTFGHWAGVLLDDVAHRQFYIPPDFAHGFVVLSETADFVYKCSNYYDSKSETGIAWNDPEVGIEWPADLLDAVQLNEKDKALPRLRDQAKDKLPAYAS